jgi:hypothetical protein
MCALCYISLLLEISILGVKCYFRRGFFDVFFYFSSFSFDSFVEITVRGRIMLKSCHSIKGFFSFCFKGLYYIFFYYFLSIRDYLVIAFDFFIDFELNAYISFVESYSTTKFIVILFC